MTLPYYHADWRDTRRAAELRAAADALLVPAGGALQPGRVLLFRLGRANAPRHCGIAVDARRFTHAQEGLGVIEANLTEGWRRRLASQYDFPGVTD
jgi:cell wall-associated NlpC family hydrolase